jgi:hypothetical protein
MVTIDLPEHMIEFAYFVVCDALEFYNLSMHTDIEVSFDEGLPDAVLAACYPEVNGSFYIGLNESVDWNPDMLIRMLGHEMTHVKQFITEGLNLDAGIKTAKFKNKYYRLQNNTEYFLAPWEMEARAMEEFFLWRACEKKVL